MTPKPINYFPLWVVITLLGCLFAFAGGFAVKSQSEVFYDGEGNILPHHAIDSLIQSQFVHISTSGQDTIHKYFNQ